jgi:hypothetical protein
MLNKNVRTVTPEAALRPFAGSGAGAFLCAGDLAYVGAKASRRAGQLPRRPWATADRAGSASGPLGGYQPISSAQFDHMTLINPVATGGLGPHPVREPEPV